MNKHVRLLYSVIVAFLCIFIPQRCLANLNQVGIIKQNTKLSLRSSFPVSAEWSTENLAKAMLYAQEIGSSAVVVLHKGQLVIEWGETTLRIKSHSVRKSLLSALFGIAMDKGIVKLSTSLAELGIDDRPPCLTVEEKKATVVDLLKSRSGVYHLSSSEAPSAKRERPLRGAYPPGAHWYYNNWDFNALGTIFERQTNITIAQAFKNWIADPIGMQDFRLKDVQLEWEQSSIHPAYPFWITARDLARFGQLYLQEGLWENKQVIPAKWIKESVTLHSKTPRGGYGYMWWIHSQGAYSASGFYGQKLLIIPKYQIVIVNRVFTGTRSIQNLPSDFVSDLSRLLDPVNDREFKKLVDIILKAGPF